LAWKTGPGKLRGSPRRARNCWPRAWPYWCIPDDERYQGYIGKNAITPLFKVPVPIMSDTKADPEKGTGVVMVCTFGDQTDVEWWQAYNLPLRQVLGRDGHLMDVQFVAADQWRPDSEPAEATPARSPVWIPTRRTRSTPR
jgi:hypothetical protein